MLKLEMTTSIKRDLKKYKHQKEVLVDLQEIIGLLLKEQVLPSKNRDHNWTGNWVKHRECHIRNDVLLIYKVEDGFLFLTRFGSHSELFN